MLTLGCGQYLRNPFFQDFGSKMGVRVVYSCGFYTAVYGMYLCYLKFSDPLPEKHIFFYLA